MADRRYFLAHGESETKVRDFFAARVAAIAVAHDLAKELGSEGPVGSSRISGFLFREGAPEGWTAKGRTTTGQRFYLPLRRSKAGKELNARISSMSFPSAINLHSLFSKDGGHMGQSGTSVFIAYISAEIAKGKVIISVPEGMDFVPPESTQLKMSEYWALKEAGETAEVSS